MSEDINQEILTELRKMRRTNQIMSCVVLVLLAIAVAFIPIVRHYRLGATQASRQARAWDEVTTAMHDWNYPKALSLTQTIIKRNTNDYYGYSYLGYIYVEMGDLTNAEAQYSRAYELWPNETNEKNLNAIRKRISREQTEKPQLK